MRKRIYDFYFNSVDWRLWAWKGDYLNLGAGAELGIYKRLYVLGKKTPHWTAATQNAMKMKMSLMYNGKTIISYRPNENQWWITGFNPYYLNVNATKLKATFTVWFDSENMYDAFYKKNNGDDEITFYSNSRKITITF